MEMENKEKMLDELFVLEDENKNQAKKTTNEVHSNAKEEDIKSINKDVNELSKAFDKKNKENYNKLKKEELKNEKEDSENTQTAVGRKSKVSVLLALLSFPYVVLGGIIVWNGFFASVSINPLAILTVLMCITSFALGVKSLVCGIKKEGSFKTKFKPILLGVLGVALAVVIIILRSFIETSAYILLGTFGVIISFIALFAMAFKREKTKIDVVKTIMSGLACVGAVLLLLAGLLWADVSLYMQITGIYLTLIGCSLFIF